MEPSPVPPDSSNVNELESGGLKDVFLAEKKEQQKEEKKDNDKEEEEAFKLQAKNIFLTYAKCPLGGQCIIDELMDRIGITKWIYGDELHADGSPHTHVLITLSKKPCITDERFFDVADYHPNIKRPPAKGSKRWFEQKTEYCMKDGNYRWNFEPRIIGSFNYMRKKADAEAWKNDCDNRSLKPAVPFQLYNIGIDGYEKKCGIIIIGKPSSGKSYMLEEAFKGKQVYLVPPGIHRWDNYNGERVVIYDDVKVAREEAFRWTERHLLGSYLPARYANKKMPKERVCCIISCNEDHKPDWMYSEGVTERFHIIFHDQHSMGAPPPGPP